MSKKKTSLLEYTTSIFRKKEYAKYALISFVMFAFFYTFMYGLWKIPFIEFGIGRFSTVGIIDYVFITFVALIASVLFTLMKYERMQKLHAKTKAATAGGIVAGFVAAICPACQGITIAALGISVFTVPLAFLIPILGAIQIATIIILLIALYLKADSIYTKKCSNHAISSSGKEPLLYRNNIALGLVFISIILLLFNQMVISYTFAPVQLSPDSILSQLPDSELAKLQGTIQSVAVLFPVSEISTADDAIRIMIPQGTPEYGQAMGVTFDNPADSLQLMQRTYNTVKTDFKQNSENWQRYLNLALKPVGISCEFCCGVGPIGIDKSGELSCGCSHNVAVHTLTMWLIKNTDYTDAQIVKEVLKWKAVWFPRNMVQIAMQSAEVMNK